MRLTKLRIIGFKTFVEPTDILIEPGLSGIVGPNGCGKSNLVEALRWVMGESSHKNMRASGMDDVIFGGSSIRPARNTAEVTLAIDNSDRLAPAAFNDTDSLEVSRRIERAQGSSYHVNGREVRARDVQLLFADAATGARSPALVRQGQISELIAAKPQARRRILEDAAGIAGLHARRHEAEQRLRQTEENLLRVDDVVREIDAQADNLRRQGRQASRYRELSALIRKIEAQFAAFSFRAAEDERLAAEAAGRENLRAVAERTAAQAEVARAEAVASHEIGPLREAEAAAASGLRRLVQARVELDSGERRARERIAEVERRIAEGERDNLRQAQTGREAAETGARLKADAAALAGSTQFAAVRRAVLQGELGTAEAELATGETLLAAVEAETADLTARRSALGREGAGERERADRAAAEAARLRAQLASLEASRASPKSVPLRTTHEAAEAALNASEEAASAARVDLAKARDAGTGAHAAAVEAERAAQRLETELRTLAKLFSSGGEERFPTMLDALTVARGQEAAVAAALGDDLAASPDPRAPVHWQDTGTGAGDPALPDGATPLTGFVSGAAALKRRLNQVGLVDRAEAPAMVPHLRVGQRLVSIEGDLWRWDGLTASAEAPKAATRRLAEKNRLAELESWAGKARATADARQSEARAADVVVQVASRRETGAIDAARNARRGLDEARDALARAERRESEGNARRSALVEAIAHVETGEREARSRATAAEEGLAELPDGAEGERRRLAARASAAEERARVADLRATLGSVAREAEAATTRKAALASDIRLWTERAERAGAVSAELAERLAVAEAERHELAAAPDTFILRRHALASETADAEARRSKAADRLVGGERALAEAGRAARTALDALAAARERRAASEARAQAASRRVAELARSIEDMFETGPSGLLALAGLKEGAPPDPGVAETRLAGLRAERERLGGVNLRAEEELADTQGKRDQLAEDRDDLVEAIKTLRQAVSSLNRDARDRLNAAFGTVDAHFRRLFTRLFDGGEAELTLVDSDDPLEAGLEIVARPPGKKPQTLSLLSGGEQALTAIALIFAVFLTNPSPICVLDEVDAPLDDANVERYCDLLRAMSGETDTRFLVITHNPITMARMDRLFGVTMAERGVSQLVSVNLVLAEQLRDTG